MRITQRRFTVGGLFIAIGLLFAVTALFLSHAFANVSATDDSANKGRLMTVYDKGVETAFLTEAKTVEDALKAAGIDLDVRDAVEPARDETLVATDYRVNIYRARPVTVIDGAVRQQVMTPYQTAEQIATDAKISLFPEDIARVERADGIIFGGAGLELIVDRATPIVVDFFGKKTHARTQASTVDELLKEKDITLTSRDRVSLDGDTKIYEGINVRVWREGKQTVAVEEDVDFPVKKIEDADRPVGYRDVKVAGEKGKRTAVYDIVVKDGKEISRKEISAITTVAPKAQTEVVGTKPTYRPYTGGGTQTEWLSASSIAKENWGYAQWLVQKESGWNPNAINKSSGACGLAQALPCSKVPGDPLNPVNSLNWMNGYVQGRYGSWENAIAHSERKGWY